LLSGIRNGILAKTRNITTNKKLPANVPHQVQKAIHLQKVDYQYNPHIVSNKLLNANAWNRSTIWWINEHHKCVSFQDLIWVCWNSSFLWSIGLCIQTQPQTQIALCRLPNDAQCHNEVGIMEHGLNWTTFHNALFTAKWKL